MDIKRHDSRARSVLKALSWRVLATLTTVIVSYLVTSSVTFALTIGVFEMLAKIVLYYFHERAWLKLG